MSTTTICDRCDERTDGKSRLEMQFYNRQRPWDLCQSCADDVFRLLSQKPHKAADPQDLAAWKGRPA